MKGSIIQLANGELKKVEDLKTEDFIQSAEISTDLKIDSSTGWRGSRTATASAAAVIQFAVGDHRAQVTLWPHHGGRGTPRRAAAYLLLAP